MTADTTTSTVSIHTAQKRQIAFIDTSVADYQTLAQHIQADVEVVLIDGARDGLVQMAAALSGRSGLEAVHLFSHGAAGLLQVGSTRLTLANMDDHAAGLAAFRDALGGGGDLLIYGCDVAQGEGGAAFVAALAQATGADVAASSDATGSALLGGNWTLEAHRGTVDASIALGEAGMSAYGATLAIDDENFDGPNFDGQFYSIYDVGNWRFTANTDIDAGSYSINEFDTQLNRDGTPGVDRVAILNANGANASSFTMGSFDGSNFKLESFKIGHLWGSQYTVSITAWSNGVQVVGAESVNLDASDSVGNISYTMIGNVSGERYGTLTFNAAYGNIDEIRFSFGSAATMEIEDIDVSPAVLPDTTAPAVSGNIVVPANGSYRAGQTLSFTVGFDENVTVTGTDSSLGLTIGATARSAAYASKTASSITYTYTVQAGDNDANGIAIGALALGATTVRDAAGNNANVSLTGHLPSTASVLVDTTAPAVSGNLAVPADGIYATGHNLDFTVTFDENVTVTGTDSMLALTIGTSIRNATFLSASGNTVTYRYTMEHGYVDSDGIAIGTLFLGTSTIRDAAGNSANLSLAGHLPSTSGVLVDSLPPYVDYVEVPADATYVAGQHLNFTVVFDENMIVTGTDSTLGLTIGSAARDANFLSKTVNSVTYRYTVQAGDLDANGIAVGSLSLGTSTIKDAAGNNAMLFMTSSIPPTNGILVDALAPAVSNVALPANGSYAAGRQLDFTVSFDDDITVTGTDSTLGLTIGANARSADFVSKTANSITYRYTVQAGELDADGIAIGSLALGSGTIRDATGNNASLSLAGQLPSTGAVLVDAIAPGISGNIAVPANGSYRAGQALSFTVGFDENVTVTGTDSSLALTIGATARSAAYASKTANSITYTYTVQAGDLDADGIAIGALALGSSTVRDAAGNNANVSLTGHLPSTASVLVDTTAPAVSGNLAVPADGIYATGHNLDFTVTFDENVIVTGTDSKLALTIDTALLYANFLSASGNTVTYRHVLTHGYNDPNGIAVGNLSLGTSTIKDAAGNSANLSLAGHLPSTSGVLVDSRTPYVNHVEGPANATYVAGQHLDFTVYFDENIFVTGTDSQLGLTIGSATRNASFLSQSADRVTYRYTVQVGDLDTNGISVGSLSLGTSTIKDAPGNNANLFMQFNLPVTTGVLVDALAPVVSNVALPANGSYAAGQQLDFTVGFDGNVTVTGTDSTLGLTIGANARSADFVSKAANSITYRYTVQAGDLDADGIAIGSLALGTSTIRDAAGNNASLSLAGHLPSTGALLVDAIAPGISGNIAVPANGSYRAGQTLSFTVGFDENVTVTGTDSSLALTIGATARSAAYASKTANSITYTYTVQAGDLDADGIAIGALALGGSTIRDAAGNNANLSLAGHLPSTAGVLVDTSAPAISGNLAMPANATYVLGQHLDFTISFDENVVVTGTDSALGLTVGATTRSAGFLSASGNSVTYRYTVQAGDLDANGITVGALALGASTIRDAAGNHAGLTLAGHLPSTSGVLVDALAPAVVGVTAPSNATYMAGQSLDFTVTFDENVTVTGADSSLGLTVGSTARSASFLSSSGNTVTYRYTVQAGDVDANGIAVGSLALGASTIKDATGNDASLSLLGHVPSTVGVLVDALAPAIAGNVTAPANATYVAGQHLDFTVSFDDNITVTGTDSMLGLTIGSAARYASFLSGTGNSLSYRYTVQAGDLDADGIAIGVLSLGTSTIRDATGNNAGVSLAGHLPSTIGVRVDAAGPAVTGMIAVPANATYAAGQVLSFTVGFDESVVLIGTDLSLGLTIGSSARSAVFASKTANSITYTYTVQAGDNDADGIAIGALSGTSTIADAVGNHANLSLAGHLPSTAAVLADTLAPAFVDAMVNGATLVMSYAESTPLDPVHVPAAGAFSVNAGGTAIPVSAVAVDATAHKVTLTLASPVASGQAVTVAYADPTAGNDASAIQDAAGNDAASLAASTVLNTTPAPAPVATQPVTVDGVVLEVGTRVNGDGSVSQVLTVPVVTASRQEQVGNNTAADIPLGAVPGKVKAQVPTGLGMTVSVPAAAGTAASALTDLVREIQAHTMPGSQDQGQLSGGGSSFLAGLAPATPLQVLTIVPNAGGNGVAPAGSLVISGTPAAAGNPYTALVVDTRALPGSSTIELHDVEFAAVIGAARIRGGAGAQTVWGDGSSQDIMLGEGDDVLHGGGGNDIVGSAGGNDRIFGDAGDDLVFGGVGNDFIDGGTGKDVVLLAGANRADYSLRVADGKLVMTHLRGGTDGVDTVANVETLRFSNAAADTSVYGTVNRLVEAYAGTSAAPAVMDAMLAAAQKGATSAQIAQTLYTLTGGPHAGMLDQAYVKSLYQNVFHREADSGGIAFWSGKLAAGMSRADVALALANSSEKLAMQPADLDFDASDVATLVRMYSVLFDRKADAAGLNYWIAAHEGGKSMADIADAFVSGAELSGRFGNMSNAQFIDALYQSALHRQAGGAEADFWVGLLDKGQLDRGDVLLGFADSAEKIGLIGTITTSIDAG